MLRCGEIADLGGTFPVDGTSQSRNVHADNERRLLARGRTTAGTFLKIRRCVHIRGRRETDCGRRSQDVQSGSHKYAHGLLGGCGFLFYTWEPSQYPSGEGIERENALLRCRRP